MQALPRPGPGARAGPKIVLDRDPSSAVSALYFPVRGGPARLGFPGRKSAPHNLLRTAPPFFTAVLRPKIPMSQDGRRELLAALRYVMIDVLESRRGRRVAVIVFLAAWGALAAWSLPWGVILGWIPATVLAIPIGYACR